MSFAKEAQRMVNNYVLKLFLFLASFFWKQQKALWNFFAFQTLHRIWNVEIRVRKTHGRSDQNFEKCVDFRELPILKVLKSNSKKNRQIKFVVCFDKKGSWIGLDYSFGQDSVSEIWSVFWAGVIYFFQLKKMRRLKWVGAVIIDRWSPRLPRSLGLKNCWSLGRSDIFWAAVGGLLSVWILNQGSFDLLGASKFYNSSGDQLSSKVERIDGWCLSVKVSSVGDSLSQISEEPLYDGLAENFSLAGLKKRGVICGLRGTPSFWWKSLIKESLRDKKRLKVFFAQIKFSLLRLFVRIRSC